MVISVCTPPQIADSTKSKLVDDPLGMSPSSYDLSPLYSALTSNASKALRFVTSYTTLRGRDCSNPQTGTAAAFACAMVFLAIPAGVAWLLRFFSDDHPILFWIVMALVLVLEFNFMVSLESKGTVL